MTDALTSIGSSFLGLFTQFSVFALIAAGLLLYSIL